ncbi:alkane 1-monooxygenase [Streptomyces regensis]|nr:alkane 1-monooxygenase [Streptomyces regensis]
MRLGVFLLGATFGDQDPGDALRTAAESVVAAETAGFDEAWIAEHHFMTYGTCPSAITFAGHALGATDRITVGTAVSVLSTVHPVALAEQTRMLDQLSGGRFALGVGRGGPWIDLDVFHPVRGDGPPFPFPEVPLVPPPHTRPRPPVTVACTSQATTALAAARGLPMLLGMHIGTEEKNRMLATYADAAHAAGRDPAGVAHTSVVLAYVADDRDTALRHLRESLPRWLGPGLAGYVPVAGRSRPSRDPIEYAETLCRLHPVGSPEDCADHLHEHVTATGVDRVLMMVEGGGSRARTLDTIRRLGAEVLPAVRESRLPAQQSLSSGL